MEIEEDVDGDLAEDKRICIVGGGLGAVVGEHFGFDVGFKFAARAEAAEDAERGDGEGDVEADAEGGGGQDHAAERWGDSRGLQAAAMVAPTLGGEKGGLILGGDVMGAGDVAGEEVGVLGQGGHVGGVAPDAWRCAVAALVPGEAGGVFEVEFSDGFVPAARLFVAAVEEQEGGFRIGWEVGAVGDGGLVVGGEGVEGGLHATGSLTTKDDGGNW